MTAAAIIAFLFVAVSVPVSLFVGAMLRQPDPPTAPERDRRAAARARSASQIAEARARFEAQAAKSTPKGTP